MIMDKEKTEYSYCLWIDTEEEHPDIVTDMTGISPTSKRVKGEWKGGKSKPTAVWDQNVWELKSEMYYADNEWDICDNFSSFIEVINSKEAEFVKAITRFKDAGIDIRCTTFDTYWVQFRMQHEIMLLLSRYNLVTYFSILILKPD